MKGWHVSGAWIAILLGIALFWFAVIVGITAVLT